MLTVPFDPSINLSDYILKRDTANINILTAIIVFSCLVKDNKAFPFIIIYIVNVELDLIWLLFIGNGPDGAVCILLSANSL